MDNTNTTLPQRRYWVSRPDRENIKLFADELQQGHLRQGWGGSDEENLDVILQCRSQGGDWWIKLTDIQRGAYPNWRLHTAFGDGAMRKGDIVLVPNVPDWGRFSIVELLDDEYRWDPLVLQPNQDVHGCGKDYGHLRHINLLTPLGITKDAESVDARLRSTLRTPMRMWNVDYLADAIETLLSVKEYGRSVTPEQRYVSVVAKIREGAARVAREEGMRIAHAQLHKQFQAAEFEVAVAAMLRERFPRSEVELLGGTTEVNHGTDVLVRMPNPLQSNGVWLIPVQVKMHEGVTADGVDQLIKAADYWGLEGRVLGLALVTTASQLVEQEQTRLEAFCRERGIDCYVITSGKLLELMTESALSTCGY